MSAAAPSLTRHQFETMVIERVWKDPEFREEFVSDPKGTLEKYSGQKLPEHVKIVVHEEDANTMHLTIPLPPKAQGELSDEELKGVAGGTLISPEWVFTATILVLGTITGLTAVLPPKIP